MTHTIRVDESRCIRCGPGAVSQGRPDVLECIGCLHCYAVCRQGAVMVDGLQLPQNGRPPVAAGALRGVVAMRRGWEKLLGASARGPLAGVLRPLFSLFTDPQTRAFLRDESRTTQVSRPESPPCGEGSRDCPCPKTRCAFHGQCELCRARHHAKNGLPYCERSTGGKKK
jgi:ferredoxin